MQAQAAPGHRRPLPDAARRGPGQSEVRRRPMQAEHMRTGPGPVRTRHLSPFCPGYAADWALNSCSSCVGCMMAGRGAHHSASEPLMGGAVTLRGRVRRGCPGRIICGCRDARLPTFRGGVSTRSPCVWTSTVRAAAVPHLGVTAWERQCLWRRSFQSLVRGALSGQAWVQQRPRLHRLRLSYTDGLRSDGCLRPAWRCCWDR